MVMFKAKFKPMAAAKPVVRQQAEQPQPLPPMPQDKPVVPPTGDEDDTGPVPIREPGPQHEPERVE